MPNLDKKQPSPRIVLPACYSIHPTAQRVIFCANMVLLFCLVAPGFELPSAVRAAALAFFMFHSGLLASRVAQIWQKNPVEDEIDDD